MRRATNRRGAAAEKIVPARVYALTSLQTPDETLDLFVTREAAEAELGEILRDEPSWVDVLSVAPIELDERDVSPH